MMSLLCANVMAQRTVSGKVTSSEDGSSLPGVNVVLKGTTTGAVTDIDGNYKVSIPESGGILVFTFIGLATQEIAVGAQSVINVIMQPDVEQLGEVVVTALGIERKPETLGYGITSVSNEDLNVARETNVINGLQGKLSGVNIVNTSGNLGGSPNIQVRGISSLNGGNQPLLVVDGVQITSNNIATGSRTQGGFDTGSNPFATALNPDNIETLTVLKGATAAALYGSRATNGVIIVTTKSGKGAGETGRFEINSSTRFDNPLRLPDFQNTFAAGTNGKSNQNGAGGQGGFGPRFEGQLIPGPDFNTDELVPAIANPDLLNDFYQTGVTLINNIAFSQATDKGNYRLSVSNTNQTGIIPGADLVRWTASLNASSQINKKLRSTFNLSILRQTRGNLVAQGANSQNAIVGTINAFARNVTIDQINPSLNPDGSPRGQVGAMTVNPFAILNQNISDNDVDRAFGSIESVYTPIEGLSLTARLGYDLLFDERFFSTDFGQLGTPLGQFTQDNIEQRELTFDGIASYTRKIGEDFDLTILAGYQYNQFTFERNTLLSQNLVIPDLFSPNNVQNNTPTNNFVETNVIGFFQGATLTYKGWLTLDYSNRFDISSTLPLDNNVFRYNGISAAFSFTDAFDIGGSILNYGKLRLSAAEVGDDPGAFATTFLFDPEDNVFGQFNTGLIFPFNGVVGFTAPAVLPNVNILPQIKQELELGLELAFFDDKFGIDASIYTNRTNNQILTVQVPQSTGFVSQIQNAGQINNDGIEIELTGDLPLGPVRWQPRLNFTSNRVTVAELVEGLDELTLASGFNGLQIRAIPGENGFRLLGQDFARDTTSGRPIVNDFGLRIQGDEADFGKVNADFRLGFVNEFSWKGVSLSFTFDYQQGGLLFSNTVGALRRGGLAEETAVNREGTFLDTEAVAANGDGTFRDNDIPASSAQTFFGEFFDAGVATENIFDASFIKLREIGLRYSLPQSLIGNTPFQAIRVGFEARNVALIYSEIPHIDPEAGLFGSNSIVQGGVEFGAVPSTASFGFNVGITF